MDKTALTQDQLDQLIHRFGGGESSESAGSAPAGERVRTYDFRHPNQFSKDHLRSLHMIHETFARLASPILTAYLRTPVQMQMASVNQTSVADYFAQLPSSTVLHLLNAEPLPGNYVLEFDRDLAYEMIVRLLGGNGKARTSKRDMTEIELMLVRGLAQRILPSLREAWSLVSPLGTALEDTVLNPQLFQAALTSGVAVLLVFEVKLLESTGTFSLCLPYPVIEPVMGRLASQTWYVGGSQLTPTSAAGIDRHLETVPVDMAVELGSTQVTFGDLLHLQVGDLIGLDTDPASELVVLVRGLSRFLARPGLAGRHLAVQITDVLKETHD